MAFTHHGPTVVCRERDEARLAERHSRRHVCSTTAPEGRNEHAPQQASAHATRCEGIGNSSASGGQSVRDGEHKMVLARTTVRSEDDGKAAPPRDQRQPLKRPRDSGEAEASSRARTPAAGG